MSSIVICLMMNSPIRGMLLLSLCWPGMCWVYVCRAVLRVSLRWLERMEGWVHWSPVHRSISSVVVLACKITPNSSLTFLCRTLLVNLWYVPDCHIRVCYWECVMLMLRQGCLFLYIVYFHGALLLLIFQSGLHTSMTCYMEYVDYNTKHENLHFSVFLSLL
jgi:hypothetical protein